MMAFLGQAQEVIIAESSGFLKAVDIKRCTSRIISKPNIVFGDIAFTPDGKLYGVSGGGDVYEVAPETGALRRVYRLSRPGYNSMTSDNIGTLYFAGANGTLESYNPITDVYVFHGPLGGFYGAGDLIFRGGKLYLAAVGNWLVEVNIKEPAKSKSILKFDMQSPVFGIFSHATDCQSIISYAVTANGEIHAINFDSLTTSLTCVIDRLSTFGGSSQSEFETKSRPQFDNFSYKNAGCNLPDGSITANVKNGLIPYNYSIDTGRTFQTSPLFQGLQSGTYAIKIRDARGCIIDTTVQLRGSNEPFIKSVKVLPNRCGALNSVVEIEAEAATAAGSVLFSFDSVRFMQTKRYEGLPSGSYTLFVKGENNCIAKRRFQIDSIPKPVIKNITNRATSCGKSNGRISVSAENNDRASLFFSLDNRAFQKDSIFQRLKGGSYTVFVKDTFNCNAQAKVEIAPSEGVSLDSISITPTICGRKNGTLRAHTTVTSTQKRTLLFNINQGAYQPEASFTALSGGNYIVVVKDDTGCADTLRADIPKSDSIRLDSITTTNGRCNEKEGSIKAIAKGGNGKVTFSLNGQDYDSTAFFTGLTEGVYRVFARDTQNCTALSEEIMVAPECFVFLPNVFSPNGDGVDDVFTAFGNPTFVKHIKSLRIFNRWGNLIFSEKDLKINDPSVGWNGTYNGKALNNDVFIYIAEVEFNNGKRFFYKGDVTLMK